MNFGPTKQAFYASLHLGPTNQAFHASSHLGSTKQVFHAFSHLGPTKQAFHASWSEAPRPLSESGLCLNNFLNHHRVPHYPSYGFGLLS